MNDPDPAPRNGSFLLLTQAACPQSDCYDGELLKEPELAELLAIRPATLRKRRHRGRLFHETIPSRVPILHRSRASVT